MPTEQDGRGKHEADEVRERAEQATTDSPEYWFRTTKLHKLMADFALSERALATRETLEKCMTAINSMPQPYQPGYQFYANAVTDAIGVLRRELAEMEGK